MKLLLPLAIVLLLLAAAASSLPHRDAFERFLEFERTFNKSYANSDERAQRFAIFYDNLNRIEELNKQNVAAGGAGDVFGVTKFMDLAPEEFKGFYLSAQPSRPRGVISKNVIDVVPAQNLPAQKDWRNTTGVVTPVKNQEQCGSCWAFSATETIESAWVLAGRSQVILGPQQLVDCDPYDSGCNGGDPPRAYRYLINAGGQETEQEYPYTGENGACKFKPAEVAVKISSWKYVSQQASTELTTMLTYVGLSGPVSVCVDAASWQYYTGGILKTCGQNVDHCVQVTGYATESGTDVWIVRNSWGRDWGLDGYLWLERGKDLCSIAGEVTVPII